MPKKRYEYQKGSKCEQNVTRNRLRAQEKAKEKKTEKSWADMPTTQNQTEKVLYSRKFCINTYIAVNELEAFLRTQPWINHWCYTSHDKDEKDDGTVKEFHTHVLLYTYNAKTASAVKKNFDRYEKETCKEGEIPQNTLVQICNDMVSQYRYQLHLDDKDKYQYPFNERYCDDYAWWHKLEVTDGMTDTKNIALAIIDDWKNGATVYELAERYGTNFVYHIAHFQKFFALHSREEMLREAKQTEISEYFSLLLENTPINQADKNTFFMVLDFIKSECMFTYNSKINFYLEEK